MKGPRVLKFMAVGAVSLTALYVLLLFPEGTVEEAGRAAGSATKQAFVWNQDSYWKALEDRYAQPRGNGCIGGKGDVSGRLNGLRKLLAEIDSKKLGPDAPEFGLLESALFETAPLISACNIGLAEYLALAVLVVSGVTSAAEKGGIIETFTEGCNVELQTYCKDVTPGNGRLLACQYAHSDKISARCEYAVYDAASQLERALTDPSYVANECRDDLKANCANIRPGEGRLFNCLEKNDAKVSDRFKLALKDVGLKK